MSTKTLSTEAFSGIEKDMNQQTSMLTNEQINALAEKANENINLPILGEKSELVVFAKVIKFIDKKIYQVLPNEYYAMINKSSDGVSADEAATIENRIVALINKEVNIPILSEKTEDALIRMIVSQIIGALKKGTELVGKKLA